MKLTKNEIRLLLTWFCCKNLKYDIFKNEKYYKEDIQLLNKLKKEL